MAKTAGIKNAILSASRRFKPTAANGRSTIAVRWQQKGPTSLRNKHWLIYHLRSVFLSHRINVTMINPIAL
jgi:hypothetical protein